MKNKQFNKVNDIANEPVEVEEPVDEIVEVEEAVDEVVEVEEDDDTDVEDLSIETVDGIVDNCSSVYLRSEPNKNSDPVAVLNKGTKLSVISDPENMTDFYKVFVSEDGTAGFIVKDFVSLV